MTRLVHHYVIKFQGEEVDVLVMVDKGGNRCQIRNKSNVLFDGYILEGYKVFDEKLKMQMGICEHFPEYELVKIK